MGATAPGLKYKNGQSYIDQNMVREEEKIEDDERTMKFIKQVGDDIHHSIELELDYPSKHVDKKLRILDMKVWIQDQEKEVEGITRTTSIIVYEFYAKEVASKTVMNARSALPWCTKRTVLTQEVLRVMLNCSRMLPWEKVVKKVEDFVLRMQYSGYDKKFRYEVVASALNAYRIRKEADESGERPMYRPKGWNKEERAKEKIKKKKHWYEKGGNESVIFVPATPRSQLRREYQQEIRNLGFNINVVEKAGNTLKRMLQRSNPFKPQKCCKNDCLVCTTGGKGPCDGNRVTYDIRCNTCNDVYVGETSRSAYVRGGEHVKMYEGKKEQSALWKHCNEKHDGEMQTFQMNVTGRYGNDAMLRRISEGVKMNEIKKGRLINSKTEWNYFKIPRAVIE